MPVALDTETTLATNSEPIPRLVSLALCDDTDTNTNPSARLYVAHQPGLELLVKRAFEAGAIFANAPYDVTVLLRAFPGLFDTIVDAYEDGRVFDVITRQKILDAAGYPCPRHLTSTFNLGALAERVGFPGVDKADPWRVRYGELLGLELDQWPDEAKAYARRDAEATLAVFLEQEKAGLSFEPDMWTPPVEDALASQAVQARGHLALYWQTLTGLRTDQAQVERLWADLTKRMDAYADTLVPLGLATKHKKTGHVTCKEAPARAMLKRWCAEKHVRPWMTDGGKKGIPALSLSEGALGHARVPDDHPVGQWRLLKATRTLRNKTLPKLRWPVVRTRYDEFKVTSRTGSSGPQGDAKVDQLGPEDWVGDNFQNFPRDGGFRECFVAPPGHTFLISDWSGAELVTLAQTCLDWFGESKLAEALASGKDPHGMQASVLLGIPYERFDKKIPEHNDRRQLSKALNFGYPGGLGAERFCAWALQAYGLEIEPDQARSYKQIWLRTWPEMRRYFEHIRKCGAGPDRDHTRYTIRQDRAGLVRAGCTYTEAANYPFQSLAATAAKHVLWLLWREQFTSMFGCIQVLFVHDEIVTTAPIDRADEMLEIQERIMVDGWKKYCPDVPIRVESAIATRYGKY